MAKYIDREAFLEDAEERYCLPCKGAGKDHNGLKCRACWVDDMCGDIIGAPAADVAPVQHGRWLPQVVLGEKAWDCSECKTLGSPHWKWCPVCGAKMDKVRK